MRPIPKAKKQKKWNEKVNEFTFIYPQEGGQMLSYQVSKNKTEKTFSVQDHECRAKFPPFNLFKTPG